MKLTTKEKSELIAEAIVTVIILLLLNLAMLVIINQIIDQNDQLRGGIWQIKNGLSFNLWGRTFNLWSWQNIFIFIMLIADGLIVNWRLKRRYKQMQMNHIITELHYIADNHYDYRIPYEVNGDLEKVVSSINALVDSTVTAMDEERKIEQSKDELITNVSHDIRTPLTSIIGYLGLIEDKQYKDNDEILKYTHTAYVKAKQMKILVDDLFEYTKVRQPDTKLSIRAFDLIQLLEQLAADFELEASKQDKVIEVKTSMDKLMIVADAEKLVRVFNNLISNALKYGKNGHEIVLEADTAGQEAIISVSNDGSQIPTDSINHLFDRFYRVEESRSQETGGTGLGLAIAQEIVALHGGYIYAKSDAKMTSFVLHLPLAKGTKLSRN